MKHYMGLLAAFLAVVAFAYADEGLPPGVTKMWPSWEKAREAAELQVQTMVSSGKWALVPDYTDLDSGIAVVVATMLNRGKYRAFMFRFYGKGGGKIWVQYFGWDSWDAAAERECADEFNYAREHATEPCEPPGTGLTPLHEGI